MKFRNSGHRQARPRWGRIVPAVAVLVVAAGVAAVLVFRPAAETQGGRGRGQIAGTVATAIAEVRQITATVRLAGSVAAAEAAAVVAGLAGRVDEVHVALGDEVTAGEAIAHVSALSGAGGQNAGAAYRLSSPSPSPTPCASSATPCSSPSSSPSVPPTIRQPTSPQPTRPSRSVGGGGVPPTPGINVPDFPGLSPDITLPSRPTDVTVAAPFDGRVTDLSVVAGSSVSASTVIATVSGDGLEVRADAGPAQAAELAKATGARASVRPAIPGTTTQAAATVSRLAPAANAATGQTPVVLTFTGDASAFKPGDPVTVDVHLPAGEGIVVPADAVVYPDGRPTVFVVQGQLDPASLGVRLPANLPSGVTVGRVRSTPVELGVRAGDEQQVTGVEAGAVVVATGQSNLVDGARVAILASPTPTPMGTR